MDNTATSTPTPTHLLPDHCYVCGGAEHPDRAPEGHNFWSNRDARTYFRAESKRLGDGPTWADGVYAEEKPMPEVALA